MAVDEQRNIVAPPPLPNQYPRIIAGFWRRAWGAVIDGAILGFVGKALGFVCFEWLVSLRSWDLLLGAAIAALYYIPLNSRLGGGRTVGKRFVGTRVVGHDGKPVSVKTSAIRFLVFAVLLFARQTNVTTPFDASWLGITLDVVVISFAWTTFYLLVFNRRTRQTVHDLAARTFVVEDAWSEGPVTQRIWKGHAIAVGLLVILAATVRITVPPLILHLAEKKESSAFRERAVLWEALRNQPDVVTISWEKKNKDEKDRHHPNDHFGSDESATNQVNLKVTLAGRPTSFKKEADQVAAILLSKYPPALKAEEIKISIAYGFDLGIADSEKSEETELSPKEWQQRIGSPVR